MEPYERYSQIKHQLKDGVGKLVVVERPCTVMGNHVVQAGILSGVPEIEILWESEGRREVDHVTFPTFVHVSYHVNKNGLVPKINHASISVSGIYLYLGSSLAVYSGRMGVDKLGDVFSARECSVESFLGPLGEIKI